MLRVAAQSQPGRQVYFDDCPACHHAGYRIEERPDIVTEECVACGHYEQYERNDIEHSSTSTCD